MARIFRVWPMAVIVLFWTAFFVAKTTLSKSAQNEVVEISKPTFVAIQPTAVQPPAYSHPNPPERKALPKTDAVSVPPAQSSAPEVAASTRQAEAEEFTEAAKEEPVEAEVSQEVSEKPAASTAGIRVTPGQPSLKDHSGEDLASAAANTLKGVFLTIELSPPGGIGRDQFLQQLGARQVTDADLWDSSVIERYELAGQVYVFRLSNSNDRILLPPAILGNIVTAVRQKTAGAPLYRARIVLGPQGRVTVTDAEIL